MALITATDGLAAGSSAAGTAGASGSIIAANAERNGLRVTLDSASTGPIYLLLGSGTASATNFHICLAAGGTWDGRIGDVLWRGAIQCFGTGGHFGVIEV